METTQILISQAEFVVFAVGLAMSLTGFALTFLVFFPTGGGLDTDGKMCDRDKRMLACLLFQWIGWMLAVAAGVVFMS